jgi:hypothetical protein
MEPATPASCFSLARGVAPVRTVTPRGTLEQPGSKNGREERHSHDRKACKRLHPSAMPIVDEQKGDAMGENAARHTDRHYEALLEAEARRLARELYLYGPLSKRTLAQRCHARHWRDGTFRDAVRAGIRNKTLRELPLDFLDVPRPREMEQLGAREAG